MRIVHYRTDNGTQCNTKAAIVYTSAMQASISCAKCRRLLGLRAYDPLAAIGNMIKLKGETQ